MMEVLFAAVILTPNWQIYVFEPMDFAIYYCYLRIILLSFH